MTHESTAARRIRESLRISWQEGSFASAMLAVVEYYLVPYALFLGATTKAVGFLVAFQQLIGSLGQLVAGRAVMMGWMVTINGSLWPRQAYLYIIFLT